MQGIILSIFEALNAMRERKTLVLLINYEL